MDTVAIVEEKIHAPIQQANDAQSQRTAQAEARHPETRRPRARPAQNSIVEPYRDIVIREVQRGGITERSILFSNSKGSPEAPIQCISISSSFARKFPRPCTQWRSPRRQTCHDSRSPEIRCTKRC